MRDSCTVEEARNRIDAQMSIEDKRKRATIVLDNTGTREELIEQVNKVRRSDDVIERLGLRLGLGLGLGLG